MSRFVSGGTNDEPTERDDAWLKAQQEIEARHKEKLDASNQDEGKSLFEKLQANKAAKQDAFEESIRLKNQFRSLDEDEVEFLGSVLESSRAKEAAVKKETSEQLDAFRKQQEDAEKAARQQDTGEETVVITENWAAGRKRRKGKDKEGFVGVKLRRTSTTEKPNSVRGDIATPIETTTSATGRVSEDTKTISKASPTAAEGRQGQFTASEQAKAKSPSPAVASLGLANYSSDED